MVPHLFCPAFSPLLVRYAGPIARPFNGYDLNSFCCRLIKYSINQSFQYFDIVQLLVLENFLGRIKNFQSKLITKAYTVLALFPYSVGVSVFEKDIVVFFWSNSG